MLKHRKILIAIAGALIAAGGAVVFIRHAAGPACVSGDCEDGTGRLEFDDGGRYEGEFRDGKFHGEGTFSTRQGEAFSGQWAAGKKVKGAFIDLEGATYSGEYRNDLKHGTGTFTWADGTKYTGEWADGETEGAGVLTLSDGKQSFAGVYRKGVIHDGAGVLIYPDGSRYVGEFQNGQRHGRGILSDAEGRIIRAGLWAADKPAAKP